MDIELHVTSEALDYIVTIAAARNQGARPVRQLVTQYVDEPLTEHIVGGEPAGQIFEFRIQDGEPVTVRTGRTEGEIAPLQPAG